MHQWLRFMCFLHMLSCLSIQEKKNVTRELKKKKRSIWRKSQFILTNLYMRKLEIITWEKKNQAKLFYMNYNYLTYTYSILVLIFCICHWFFLLIRTAGRDINSSYINDVDNNHAAAHTTLNIVKYENIQVSTFQTFKYTPLKKITMLETHKLVK